MNSLQILPKRVAFYVRNIPARIGQKIREARAYRAYKHWMKLEVPEDEFDPSLNTQWFTMYLHTEHYHQYQVELVKRRRIAHERSM